MNPSQIGGLINGLLDALASRLGPLSPFTKAVVPAALSLAAAGVTAIVALISNSPIATPPLYIAGAGLVLALITFLVPNKPVVKPVVPPPPVPAPPPPAPAKPSAKPKPPKPKAA